MTRLKQGPALYRPERLPPRGQALKILRVGKDDQWRLVVLSPAIELFQGHWLGHMKKTKACTMGPKLCPHCLKLEPTRTYGFVHCYHSAGKDEVVLQLTVEGCYNLEDVQKVHGRLRGLQVLVERYKKRITQPLCFTELGLLAEGEIQWKSKPCQPSVERIWLFEKNLGAEAVSA